MPVADPLASLDDLVQATLACLDADDVAAAAIDLLRQAVARPDEVEGLFTTGGFSFPVHTELLTLAQGDTPPGDGTPAHEHLTWAAIGVYRGVEHNVVYEQRGGELVVVDEFDIRPGEVRLLPPDLIHAVHNRGDVDNGWLNIYGGPLFQLPRRQWAADATPSRRAPSPRVLDTLRRTMQVGFVPDGS